MEEEEEEEEEEDDDDFDPSSSAPFTSSVPSSCAGNSNKDSIISCNRSRFLYNFSVCL